METVLNKNINFTNINETKCIYTNISDLNNNDKIKLNIQNEIATKIHKKNIEAQNKSETFINKKYDINNTSKEIYKNTFIKNNQIKITKSIFEYSKNKKEKKESNEIYKLYQLTNKKEKLDTSKNRILYSFGNNNNDIKIPEKMEISNINNNSINNINNSNKNNNFDIKNKEKFNLQPIINSNIKFNVNIFNNNNDNNEYASSSQIYSKKASTKEDILNKFTEFLYCYHNNNNIDKTKNKNITKNTPKESISIFSEKGTNTKNPISTNLTKTKRKNNKFSNQNTQEIFKLKKRNPKDDIYLKDIILEDDDYSEEIDLSDNSILPEYHYKRENNFIYRYKLVTQEEKAQKYKCNDQLCKAIGVLDKDKKLFKIIYPHTINNKNHIKYDGLKQLYISRNCKELHIQKVKYENRYKYKIEYFK